MLYSKIVKSNKIYHTLNLQGLIVAEELVDGGIEIKNINPGLIPRIENFIIDDSVEDFLKIIMKDSKVFSTDVRSGFHLEYRAKNLEENIDRFLNFVKAIYEGNFLVQKKKVLFKDSYSIIANNRKFRLKESKS